jgi:hypothetical protein
MTGRVVKGLLPLAGFLILAIVFYRAITLTNSILVGFDTFTYFYPYETYAAESLRQGHLPLWNPYLFTGVPFLANLQSAIFYPLNLLFLLLPVPTAYSWSVVIHVALAGFFMYLFCRRSLDLGALAAICGAVIFMFAGFTNSLVGHINQLQAATWIPLLFLLSDMAYRRRDIRFAALGGVVLAMQLFAGHAQESYLTIFALGLFMLFRIAVDWRTNKAVQNGVRRLLPSFATIAIFGLVLAFGFGLAAIQLLPSAVWSALLRRQAYLYPLPYTMFLTDRFRFRL